MSHSIDLSPVTLVSLLSFILVVSVHVSASPEGNHYQDRSRRSGSDDECNNEGACFKCFIGSENNYDHENYCFSSADNCTLTVAADGRVTRGCSDVRGTLSGCIWEDGYKRCYCGEQFCNAATQTSSQLFVISVFLLVVCRYVFYF